MCSYAPASSYIVSVASPQSGYKVEKGILSPPAEIDALAAYLKREKERNGWRAPITISDWSRIGPGHANLIEPDGRAIASPVWEYPDCLLPFGSLEKEDIQELWHKYPYKQNHLNKYLENMLIVV
jgi:hypothetical protein